ncbi:MAG: hypothetical protein ACR2OI_11660 [Acidimicrobiia bacterium]
MSLWKRLTAIFKREAADVAEGLTRAGQALDDELARKERELEASPEERIDMILEEQEADDARFQELSDRVLGSQETAPPPDELAPEPDATD